MRLPSLSILKDKWVLIGLAAGAGVYMFMGHGGHGHSHMAPKRHIPMIHHPVRHGTSSSHDYFPHYDSPGLYETGQTSDFSHMHFSGQAELQRRLTIS